MNPDWTNSEVKTPFYSTWWFFMICLLGVLYVASIVAIPILDKDIQRKYDAPEKITYTWTDESGVAHYSDTKPDLPADRVSVETKMREPNTVDRVEIKALSIARKSKPLLGPLLLVFAAALAIVKGLQGTFTLAKRLKEKLAIRSFESALGKCVQMADDFGVSLKDASIDKEHYTSELGKMRTALEKLSACPLAHDYHYRTVVEHLRNAFEAYVDCLSLWDIKSQRDIVQSERNVFINKYPTLIDKTTGIDCPLSPEELQKAAKGTLWKYAEGYIIQAGRLFERLRASENQAETNQ